MYYKKGHNVKTRERKAFLKIKALNTSIICGFTNVNSTVNG